MGLDSVETGSLSLKLDRLTPPVVLFVHVGGSSSVFVKMSFLFVGVTSVNCNDFLKILLLSRFRG